LRLRTDFFVSALIRRAEAGGAFAAVARRGAAEAGAVFVLVDRRDASFDLYGPAPQSVFADARPADRVFAQILARRPEVEAEARLDQERRFDPDLWIIGIEDKDGRPFVELMAAGN
jgi:hypothetical protein